MDSKDKEIKRLKIALNAARMLNDKYDETLKQEREMNAKISLSQVRFTSNIIKLFEKSLDEAFAVPEEEDKEKPSFDYDSHYMCFADSDVPQCIYDNHRQCTVPSNSWDAIHCKYRCLDCGSMKEEEKENGK